MKMQYPNRFRSRTVFCLCTPLVLLLLTVLGTPLCAEGLLKNSGFDDLDAKGMPNSWRIPYELIPQWAKVVDDDGHSGKQCLRFHYQVVRYSPPVVQTFSCKPNTKYLLSVWFKSDGKLKPVIAVAEPTTT